MKGPDNAGNVFRIVNAHRIEVHHTEVGLVCDNGNFV